MRNFFFSKRNIYITVLFISLIFYFINLSSNSLIEEITLDKIDKTYINNKNDEMEEKCFSYSIALNEEIENIENLYIHFSSYSDDNNQQILYSTEDCPTSLNAEKYNYKYSSELFINFPNTKDFYLTIKCKSYPCSFSLETKIEKDYANLNLKKSDSYSYFVSNKDKLNNMIFKIPSSKNEDYPESFDHILTISVTNPSDLDYNQLYLLNKGNKTLLNVDHYKTSMNIIFTFIEEDYIQEFSDDIFYALEINSMNNQFVSISVKASRYNIPLFMIFTDIIPNTNSKYSYLFSKKEKQVNEECFKLDEKYKLDDKDLLYASIEYFTYPKNPFFKYDEDDKIYEYDIEEGQTSINIILEKRSDKYPSICFNSAGDQTAFMLQVSHISKENENIDIYNPLTSGFIHTKTLNKNNLALFTHISDVHHINKLSFYLKVLNGNPEMYIVQCDDYPNCYNKIDELNSDNNVIRPKIKDNIYRYTYSNKEIMQDLSPYGSNQNLLYVYCPEENNNDEYCQFQILINSNLDEIALLANDTFYSYLLKDDIDLYKIYIKKRNESIKKIQIILNTTEDIQFEYFLQDLKNFNITNETKDNSFIFEYIPNKNVSFDLKDYDISFNIKAKKDIYYSAKYEIIINNEEEKDGLNLTNLEFGKIKEINELFSLPIKIYSVLPFTKDNNQYDFKDLLLNFIFQSINNDNPQKTNTFEQIEIKATIINNAQLNNIRSTKKDDDIFDKNILNVLFDLSTRTAILNINKTFLEKFIDKEELILYFTIDDANNKEKKDINLSGKTFLFFKNDTEFIIPENNYINDNLYIDNNNYNYNLYHLKLEGNEKKNYIVEFSSNVDLDNEGLYISFLDSDIKNIQFENLLQNSSNVIFNKPEIKIGGIHYFNFTLKNEIKDIILCVGTKLKKEEKGLSYVYYIFKYIDKDNKKFEYELNDKIKLSDSGDNTKIEFEKIKKTSQEIIERPNAEIYIRKIKNKLNREIFNTISIIESDYELINKNISEENEKIIIEIPKISENDVYSILINLLETNEKFVYDTIIKKNKDDDQQSDTPGEEDNENKDGDKNVLVIVSVTLSLIVLIVIVILAFFYYRNKRRNLQNDVMKTSFENSGVLDELNDRRE